ncbi:hypothetical protein AU253_18220 [Yersinia pestis]|nr:hypothetical protein AU253_18220 [Yersinia pestis]
MGIKWGNIEFLTNLASNPPTSHLPIHTKWGEREQTRVMTGLRAQSQNPGGGKKWYRLNGGIRWGEGFRLGTDFIKTVHNFLLNGLSTKSH